MMPLEMSHAPRQQRSFHIVQNREPRKESETLKHNRQVGGAIVQRLSVPQDDAFGGLEQAREDS